MRCPRVDEILKVVGEKLAGNLPEPNIAKVLDGVSDGVIITDPERTIVFINEAARNILGYSAGKPWGGAAS